MKRLPSGGHVGETRLAAHGIETGCQGPDVQVVDGHSPGDGQQLRLDRADVDVERHVTQHLEIGTLDVEAFGRSAREQSHADEVDGEPYHQQRKQWPKSPSCTKTETGPPHRGSPVSAVNIGLR